MHRYNTDKATLFVKMCNGFKMINGNPIELCSMLNKVKAPAWVEVGEQIVIGYKEPCDSRCDQEGCSGHVWLESGPPWFGLTMPNEFRE
jgi:hypothetical protein